MEITPIDKLGPQLIMPEKVYNKLLTNIRATKLEMTFILHIKRIENTQWAFETVDVHIPPQWNEPAESKTLDSEYPSWCYKKITEEKVSLNGHGHTHPMMSTNPSGYDIKFFNELTEDTNTFQFRLIANHKGHIRCDLIDKEKGFICSEITIIVPCKGFNLYITKDSFSIIITDRKELEIIDINSNFEVTLASTYLDVTKSSITNMILEEDLILKETRKAQTNEREVYKTSNNSPKHYSENNHYGYQTSIYEWLKQEEEYEDREYPYDYAQGDDPWK